MKFILSLAIFMFTMFCSNAAQAAISVQPTPANVIKIDIGKASLLMDTYYYILMNDGCFHLARLNPPGFVDPNTGAAFSGWSVTFLSNYEFTGTVCICPSTGTAYC